MAVRIRMKRMGRRHRPFYRVAVMDSQSPRDGRSIEDVGYYDPMVPNKSERVNLKMDRIDYWLSVGAQPSEKGAGLIKKVKTNKFGAAKMPPPMTPPKAPPEPVATEETVETEKVPEAASEEAADKSAPADEAAETDAAE